MSLDKAIKKSIKYCVDNNILKEFFEMYKFKIFKNDVLDGSFKHQLELHERDVRKDTDRNARIDVAENMLKMKMSYEQISEATKLTIEEIKKIESDMYIDA